MKADLQLVVENSLPKALLVNGEQLDGVYRVVLTQQVHDAARVEIELIPDSFKFEGAVDLYMRPLGLDDLLADAVTSDESHHQKWYVERIAELLHVELPEHEAGIAP